MENLKMAHKNAKKGKNHYSEVKMVDSDPDLYLSALHESLKNKTFRNSKYEIITKETDSGKVRDIYKLPYYPDRIVHHAILQVVGEIWYKGLIRDTYSSIKGRGIHDGVERMKKAMQDKENTRYCLKLDVKKYYQSIDNEMLKVVVRKKIKDPDLLWLLDEIIDSTEGVPIGNYLSQYFGNIYLSGLDHYCKSKVKYYFRYCDDIVILHKDKAFLHTFYKEIETWLNGIKLEIKDNWQVFPVDKRGIDFLGYRFFHDYILLRKSIKQNLKRSVKRIKTKHTKMNTSLIINSIMSYYGWFKHANCKNLQNSIFDDEICHIIKHRCIRDEISNPLKKVI
jgi:hypothetical protein